MANPEHLEILEKGVTVWNQWRESDSADYQYKRRPVDLRLAELKGADLVRADLCAADLRDAELTGAHVYQADLSHADFSNAKLSGAVFDGANMASGRFVGANLRQAHLKEVNLHGAYLQAADLRRADLFGADLRWADLNSANLRGVELRTADLRSANLFQVDLSEAVFGGTTIGGHVDLRQVVGLESVSHVYGSTLGVDTLEYSEGQVPTVFLRGCGVDERLIDYLSSVLGRAIEYYSSFISYSHKDRSFARRLHDQLQSRGIRCWLDEHQLLPGDDIRDSVDLGIRFWDRLLLCCSKESLRSWWVDDEIEKALQKEESVSKQRGEKIKVIVPLNLDGYLFSDEYQSGHKSFLKRRRAADFSGWQQDNAKFETELENVVRALRTDDGGRPEAPPPKL